MLILVVITCGVFLVSLILYILDKGPVVNKYFFYSSIIVLILSVLLLLNEAQTRKKFQIIEDWPRTEAEIIKEKVAGHRAVLPEVTYRYIVKGNEYNGKSNLGIPAFGSRNKRTLTARIALKDLPVGSKVIVAYNPENPEISTTEFHLPWNYYTKLSLGGILYASALMILLFRLPAKRSKKIHEAKTG